MTCIIGFLDKKNRKMYIGGDTALTIPEDGGKTKIKGFKVFKKGEFLLGISGSLSILNIIKYRFLPPVLDNKHKIDNYLNVIFFDYVKSLLLDNIGTDSGTVTVLYKGRLLRFEVINGIDFFIEESDGVLSVSGATDIAIGVMELGLKYKIPIKKLIRESIIISSHNNAFVNEKIKIIEMKF
jgi:hypothetical protein